MSHPWHAWLLLISPPRVQAALDRLVRVGAVERPPTLWQLELGALRMWHRVLFRFDTVGTSSHPPRRTWRARLLRWRPARFPFLMAERAIAPWDMSGLYSSPDRVRRHLLAAHHDGTQFIYDLQMMLGDDAALARLRRELRAVVHVDSPRSRWLRDLCVYERYHEDLLAGLERFLAGELELVAGDERDPDISLLAYLRWCARQPASPAETWRAWRAGRFHPERGLLEAA